MANENDDIKRYREGSMTGSERQALEKRALSDPFLFDALEGAESISDDQFSLDVHGLSKEIRNKRVGWFTPLRIAASVILLMAVGSSIYYFGSQDPPLLALEENKLSSTPDSIAPLIGKPDSSSSMLALAKDATADKKKPQATSKALSTTPENSAEEVANPAGIAAGIAKAETQEAQPEKTETEELSVAPPSPVVQSTELMADEISKERDTSPAGAARKKSDRTAASKTATAPMRTISGNVTTAEEGIPLPGVNIVIKDHSKGTVTDFRGDYAIEMPVGESVTLSYSFVGLDTKEIEVVDQSKVDVQLNEDAAQFSEVFVVGQRILTTGRQSAMPSIIPAYPVAGIPAYNTYLEANFQFPKEALEKNITGKAIITFTVSKTGVPTHFQVVSSLGYGCEDEVIRLVREGPTWIPSLQGNVPIENEVWVKLKFDPGKARN